MRQTVWIHTFALAFGRIFARQAVIKENGAAVGPTWTYWPGEWSLTREEALVRANEIRAAEISRLKSQIAQLEALEFTFDEHWSVEDEHVRVSLRATPHRAACQCEGRVHVPD